MLRINDRRVLSAKQGIYTTQDSDNIAGEGAERT